MRAVSFLLFLISTIAQSAASESILARVNGEPVTEGEILVTFPGLDRKEALDRMILYKLAVQQAKESALDRRPEVREKLDRVLYQSYLEESARKAGQSLKPTPEEIEAYYVTKPMIRLRHLLLFARTPEERTASEKKLGTIKRLVGQKKPFRDLVLRYSQDDSAPLGGDMDYRGEENLPAEVYRLTKDLKPGDISRDIYLDGGIHLFEVIAKRPFKEIPETYRKLLEADLSREREMTRLKTDLIHLREKSKIVILSTKEP